MADKTSTVQPSNPFTAMLQATEARFKARADIRAETQAKISEGKPLEADTPERVEKRLKHLQIDPGVALAPATRGTVGLGPLGGPGPAEPGLLERILGDSDLMGISFLELGLQISRTVGRVHCRDLAGSTVGYGTGFMVSPRLMMTNNHVLDSAAMASRSQIEFNYQIGLNGKQATSLFFSLSPADFFLTDSGLDYTLVAVQAQLPDGRKLRDLGWNRLSDVEGKIIKGECVNIIQHPNGEPKQLALRENRLEDVLEQWLHYHTDTAPGSSGSPLFNDQWEVVGLHHSGVPERDGQGNILTRDGQVWHPIMGEHKIRWLANEGARCSRIVQHIKAQHLTGEAERLRNEMFESPPPAVHPSTTLLAGRTEQTGQVILIQAPGEEREITWTIPIQVTVRLAQPVQASAAEPGSYQRADSAGAISAGVDSVVTPSAPAVLPAHAPQADAALAEALAELAAGAARDYYDAGTDAQARKRYYTGINLRLAPAKLFARLNQQLKATHAKQPPYKPAKLVYPWIDLHPDRKIYSIYSGKAFDPETLIREDFRVDEERTRRANELMAREAAHDVGTLLEELSLLEVQLPYNCEHSVPQSWFGKQEPMRGDLHHLFACESGCNSFRGNHAYFDFADFEEAVRDDCGKRENNRFEPASLRGKGAVARATLYFLLRYPGLIAAAGGELDAERLPVLLAWHKASPPDRYELHRNMAIFAIQGNRNPLIDFPKWADRIDFRLGFGQ